MASASADAVGLGIAVIVLLLAGIVWLLAAIARSLTEPGSSAPISAHSDANESEGKPTLLSSAAHKAEVPIGELRLGT